MRIQHNIMAMNAYRNYTNNVSAMQSNLEKLSSGYKINRAGDDAAGLAISEKMRAQITGLETAQKNAKDGISLVQTAEGAMTEVHDMLNRMVELATQSANGTYDNSVDRAQMQKEMDQLRSEIDRIADSANFNGIKLMDGSLNSEDTRTVGPAKFSALNDIYLVNIANGTEISADSANTDLHKDAVAGGKTSFSLDFNGTSITGATANTEVTAKFKFEGVETGTGSTEITAKMTADGDGKVSAKDMAQAVYDAIKGTQTGDEITMNMTIATGKTVEYAVSLSDDGVLTFEMTDKGYSEAVNYYTTATGTDGNGSEMGAAAFRGGWGASFDVETGKGTLTGTQTHADHPNDAAAPGWESKSPSILGTTDITMGGVDTGVKLARAATDRIDIVDGAGVKIGNEYYVWAATDETMNAELGDNVHKIDVRDLADEKGVITQGASDGAVDYVKMKSEAYSRLTKAAADNEMFAVSMDGRNQLLVFTEKETYKGDADLTTVGGLQKQLRKFDSVKENVTVTKAKGKALTLQIGDTAESFNQLKVNVKDMHTKAMGIADISISDQESAATAVDKIKEAINYVSDVRGSLGATQNRLDHTMNNLSVMQENIQDAESTIRDVDVAEEMMEYTKNNILIQSAQAMLAQANQVPQGVLQLLG